MHIQLVVILATLVSTAAAHGVELAVDEGDQVVAGQRLVVVDLAVFPLGGGPAVPAIGLVEDVGVFLPVQLGFRCLVVLDRVEVLQEEQPRRLLGVIEFADTAGILVKDIVDVLEGLFKHGAGWPFVGVLGRRSG